MTTLPNPRLEAMLSPASIAVVGASSQPGRIGGRAVRCLSEGGYTGTILPVNPTHDELYGLRCWPSVAALPEVPDLALVAVRADQTAAAVAELGAKGVTTAVAMAAGFRETDEAGAELERELVEVAADAAVTLLGPNSAGFRNTAQSLYATFTTDIALGIQAGSTAIVSQSGGLAGYFGGAVPKHRGFGHKWIIDTGNEVDIDMADCIAVLARDPDVSVIGVILEGCRDGDRLRAAFDIAENAGKPVVALKIGNSDAGAKAAASHTGAMAGSDAVYDAVFRQGGVYRARNEQEFVDVLGLYDAGMTPRGRNVGVFSLSGGVATMLVDACVERGLEIPPIEPPSDPAIVAALPGGRFENPLDLTAQIGSEPQLLRAVLNHVAGLPQIDSVILGFAYMMQAEHIAEVFTPAVIEAATISGKPMIVTGLATQQAEHELRAHGVVVEPVPTNAVNALAALTYSATKATNPPRTTSALTVDRDTSPAGPIIEGSVAAAELPGIPFVPTRPVTTSHEAVAAATNGPVVLKADDTGLAHKTELGLVRPGLRSAAEIEEAFREVSAALQAHGAGQVVVQPMVSGVEVVLGLHRDPTFGPVVMVGLGGIFVEVLEDTAFGAPPLDRDQARTMLESLRGYPILIGTRGRLTAIDDLLDAIVALSAIATAKGAEIAELDINPFIVAERRGQSAAVDAVLVPASARAPAK